MIKILSSSKKKWALIGSVLPKSVHRYSSDARTTILRIRTYVLRRKRHSGGRRKTTSDEVSKSLVSGCCDWLHASLSGLHARCRGDHRPNTWLRGTFGQIPPWPTGPSPVKGIYILDGITPSLILADPGTILGARSTRSIDLRP